MGQLPAQPGRLDAIVHHFVTSVGIFLDQWVCLGFGFAMREEYGRLNTGLIVQCHTSQIHSKWRVGWIITTGIAEPLKRGHKYSSSSYRYWTHQCFEWSANFLPFVTSARLGMSTLSVLAMTVAFTLKRQKQWIAKLAIFTIPAQHYARNVQWIITKVKEPNHLAFRVPEERALWEKKPLSHAMRAVKNEGTANPTASGTETTRTI